MAWQIQVRVREEFDALIVRQMEIDGYESKQALMISLLEDYVDGKLRSAKCPQLSGLPDEHLKIVLELADLLRRKPGVAPLVEALVGFAGSGGADINKST